MGGACETALGSSTCAHFTWRLRIFTGWNWKCHAIIVFKNDLSGFVRTVRQIPRANALGIWLPVSHALSCIGTTNSSRTGLNPLNTDVASMTRLQIYNTICFLTLQWCHNEHHGVSNHHPNDCLLNRLFRRRPENISKLRATGLCEWNSPLTAEFPAQGGQ